MEHLLKWFFRDIAHTEMLANSAMLSLEAASARGLVRIGTESQSLACWRRLGSMMGRLFSSTRTLQNKGRRKYTNNKERSFFFVLLFLLSFGFKS